MQKISYRLDILILKLPLWNTVAVVNFYMHLLIAEDFAKDGFLGSTNIINYIQKGTLFISRKDCIADYHLNAAKPDTVQGKTNQLHGLESQPLLRLWVCRIPAAPRISTDRARFSQFALSGLNSL